MSVADSLYSFSCFDGPVGHNNNNNNEYSMLYLWRPPEILLLGSLEEGDRQASLRLVQFFNCRDSLLGVLINNYATFSDKILGKV